MDEAARQRARRTGRRRAMAAYYVVAIGFATIAGGNVIWQAWAPAFARHGPADCRRDLGAMAAAVERGREAASAGATEGGEDLAVTRFRAAVGPAWQRRDDVAAACAGDRRMEAALEAIERLRYAEEHAARLDAAEVSLLRRRVRAIVERDLGGRPGGD